MCCSRLLPALCRLHAQRLLPLYRVERIDVNAPRSKSVDLLICVLQNLFDEYRAPTMPTGRCCVVPDNEGRALGHGLWSMTHPCCLLWDVFKLSAEKRTRSWSVQKTSGFFLFPTCYIHRFAKHRYAVLVCIIALLQFVCCRVQAGRRQKNADSHFPFSPPLPPDHLSYMYVTTRLQPKTLSSRVPCP